MGDVRILLTLPAVGQPPWWLSSGDRPCWFTLQALLERTATVASAAR